tara:strand:+ start:3290 stop:4498 length:1209 start_codon:yes stop_codon:yes gene_type:complete
MSLTHVPAGEGVVDIIIPVYKGLDVTQACLRSVLATVSRTPFRMVVVDDCSPDPHLSAWLDELAANETVELLRNERNMGFVASVNRGVALHPERDVVILNSDTEVCGNWLDRIVGCARAQPGAATVTPFSNNASICSYPVPCEENALPEGWSLEALDAAFARANAGRHADLPTGVGFCMFIRRACWDAIGGLDESRFGVGYGEESDFCMRARAAGWSNLLAADTFVFHKGSESFGDARFERMRLAESVMQELHPDYGPAVTAFLREDPLAELRRRVNRERARRSHADAMLVEDEGVQAGRSAQARLLGWIEFAEERAQALELERDFLSDSLQEARTHGEALRTALSDAERFVREREADIAELSATVERLQADNAELTSKLDALLGSWLARVFARASRAMRKQ